MKHEWKKQEKEVYGAKGHPQMIHVPQQNFIVLNGKGNPNAADFSLRVAALYSLAYPIKMHYKKTHRNSEDTNLSSYDDYVVFPLEGIWTTSNPTNLRDKDSYEYALMIRQPDVVTREMFEQVRSETMKKKPNILFDDIRFETREEGRCVQILHTGSYDTEPESFSKMSTFMDTQGLRRVSHDHKEIYLTDNRKTAQEKQKTILRVQVTN